MNKTESAQSEANAKENKELCNVKIISIGALEWIIQEQMQKNDAVEVSEKHGNQHIQCKIEEKKEITQTKVERTTKVDKDVSNECDVVALEEELKDSVLDNDSMLNKELRNAEIETLQD